MKRKAMLMTLGVVCAFAFVGSAAIGCNDTSEPEEPEKFTVTYARGATDATGDIPEASSYAEGESFALLSSDTFARINYDFKCWSYGGEEYDAGAQFTMPADNVTFTAVWESSGGDEPDQPDPPPVETDDPTLTELGGEFYTASNWAYMTNDGGASTDGGDKVYALGDGSVKFHRANQSVLFGDQSNRTMSFMLKGTNDWSIWFNSSSKDNTDNYSYRLAYAYGGLRLVVSSAPEQAAAVIDGTEYKKGEWNRFDVEFETVGRETSIKVYINGKRATLAAGENTSPAISVADNVFKHTRPAMFETGNYVCVKVWEAHNYVQIKPVAKADEEDVPIIACIGASITEGAGAGNFYTESYPAQLQNSQGGAYNVINFGNSGKTVNEDMTEDGKPVGWLKQNQWTGVQAIKPDIAIINMGTNDSKTTNDPVCTHDTFKADYENLLTKLLGVNPDMRIYICTVPYAYSSIYGISNDNIRDIIAPVQREIAQEKGYPLIDLYEYTQGKSLLFGDGVHPNSTGYAMFVEIIDKVLEEGAEGLTPEFRAYIDEKYNDPEYELTNVHGGLAVSGDAINLTVTGNIVMDDVSNMRLAVETGTDGEEREVAIVPDANGDFTATMNIATLTSTKWYNVRVYLTETYYYFLRLTDTELTVGQKFNTSSREVTVRSWTSGGEPTFSFTVGDYNQLELTSATITESNGKINLTLAGSTNESALQLYVCDDQNHNNLVDVTVEDGEFEITFDLATLVYDGAGWYNVRLLFADGTYYAVRYTEVKNASGENIAVNDEFYGAASKVIVKTWGNENPLSFQAAAYDSTVSINIATIEMRDGKFIVTGTADNVETLSASLFNTDTDNETVQATFAGNVFTAEITLANLTAGNGNWYRFKLSADGGDFMTYKYPSGFDTTPGYTSGDRTYRFVTDYNNTDIAIVYSAYSGPTVTLSSATIEQKTDAITLTLVGAVTDTDSRYDKTLLYIGNNADVAANYHEVAVTDGAFTAEFDLATLDFGAGMQIRFYHSRNDGGANWGWYTLKIDEVTVKSGDDSTPLAKGDEFVVGNKSVTVGSSASWNPVELTVSDKTISFAVDGVEFKDGYFVVSGTAQNVENLKIYLINSYHSATANNYVEPEFTGEKFVARLPLSVIAELNTSDPMNLRYTMGNNTTTINITQGSMDISQQYSFGSKKFVMVLNGSCVAVKCTDNGYAYVISKAEIAEIDGKATLTIEGKLNDATVSAADIKLKLDKTAGTTEAKTCTNEATADGAFKFVVDISDLIASTKTENSKEEGYFLRLYNGSAKISDINSTWASAVLFEPVVIGDATYYFYRNNMTAYYTLGVCKLPNA